MEPELDRNEELEKPTKRRSSILKMPKVRNPFEEIETTETFTDINITKPVRRVSFASSNFIKPFVADPEKNTIWDTTYEEDVNHTNSTQSSQEQNLHSCTKMSSNLYESAAQISTTTCPHDATKLFDQDMEFTEVISLADKENIAQFPQRKFSLVDFARKRGTNCPNVLDRTTTSVEGMEFTRHDLKPLLKTNEISLPSRQEEVSLCNETRKAEDTLVDDNLEFTCQVTQNNLIKVTNAVTVSNLTNMHRFADQNNPAELTQAQEKLEIAQISESNITAQTMEFTCQSNETQFTKTANLMEFTCQTLANVDTAQVSGNDVSRTAQIMEFTCRSEQNNLTRNDVGNVSLMRKPGSQNNQTQFTNTANLMEFTCQTQANVETTQVLGNDVSRTAQIMELTCRSEQNNLTRNHVGNVSLMRKTDSQNNETQFTKTANLMEFTCQTQANVDTAQVSGNDVSRTAQLMEFTCRSEQNNPTRNDVDIPSSIRKADSPELMDRLEPSNVSQNKLRGIKNHAQVNSTDFDNEPNNQTKKAKVVFNDVSRRSCVIPRETVEISRLMSTSVPTFEKKDTNCDQTSHKNLNGFNTATDNKNSEISPVLVATDTILQEKSCSAMEVDEITLGESCNDIELTKENTEKFYQNGGPEKQSGVLDTACQNVPKPSGDVTNVSQNWLANQSIKILPRSPDHELTKVSESCAYQDPPKISIDNFDSQNDKIHVSLQEKSCSLMEIDRTVQSICQNSVHFPTLDRTLTSTTLNNIQPNISVAGNNQFNSDIKLENIQQTTFEDNESSQRTTCAMVLKVHPSNQTVANSSPQHSVKEHQKYSKNGTYIIQEKKCKESDHTGTFESEEQNTTNTNRAHNQHVVDKENILNKTYSKQTTESLILTSKQNTDTPQTPTRNNGKVSHIPVKVKSDAKTPVKRSQQSPSKLELNCVVPVMDESKQPALLTLKHDLSALRTPEQSFHINLTNLSSGVDDTQQLLQCSYSNNKSNLPSFVESNHSNAFVLNLEDTGHVSKPNLTNISECNIEENLESEMFIRGCRESPDASLFDIPKYSKLSNINDTYVLSNKCSEERAEDSQCEENTSVGIIADDCLQTLGGEDQLLAENAMEQLNKISDNSPPLIKKVELKKVNLKIRRISELSGLLTKIEKQRADIKSYLENFKFRPMRIPKELTVREELSDSSGQSMEISEDCKSCPTVEEKIKEHEKSCQKCWKLETIDGDYYHFSTLFGNLVFVVKLDVENGLVVDIQTCNKLKETSKPFARYIMKLFLHKFERHLIRSAIGDQFDMLSLLDYVKMTMLRLYRFQREFMMCDRLKMEEDFVAKFVAISVPLGLAFDVLVDVSDVENLSFEQDLKIVSRVGKVNENEITSTVKKCPKGLDFFQAFTNAIEEYLSQKQRRLEKTSC